MYFTEEQAKEVKEWVVKRLEDISDADSDVLADYVLALIQSDAPDDEIRRASIENLEDFLRENTVQFVDEIFARYGPKTEPPSTYAVSAVAAGPASAAPAQPPAPPQQQQQQQQQQTPFGTATATATTATDQQQQQPQTFPQIPSFVPQTGMAYDPSQQQQSRKRTFQEGFQHGTDAMDVQQGGGRSFKSPRTRRGRGDYAGGAVANGHGRGRGRGGGGQPAGYPGGMPQGFPGFDQNAMMALQNMGFPAMPGLPQMALAAGQGQPGQPVKSDQPCPFYETNGICYMGAACPYKHGQDPVVVKGDEYDPTNASIIDLSSRRDGSTRGTDRGRGRGGRGGLTRGRGGRAEFSAIGPSDDPTNTTLVVENIPDDKFNEQAIREYFAEFGNIEEVTMQEFKKQLALIRYDDHEAAKRAWSSPKAVFDNRFVKVYWYKPEKAAKTETNGAARKESTDTPMIDREEIERRQAELQRQHEERMRKRQALEEARKALEKQREVLLKRQEEEKAKLMAKLGKTGAALDAEIKKGSAQGEEHVSEQTKALRAELAALEEEAKSLGIDPNASSPPATATRGRGRGYGYGGSSYRGRGGFAPRGRGYDPTYRGGFRGGRGGFARGRGGVLRLDNRPKRVAVSGVEFTPERDEALRQYLIGIGEYESIDPNPERSDSLIVSFKDRYVAEKLMYGPRVIPSVGKVEMAWVANAPTTSSNNSSTGPGTDSATPATVTAPAVSKADESLANGGTNGAGAGPSREVDYDVAEDGESWM